MIRLELGDEPPELTTQRSERLPKAIQAFNDHGAGAKELTDLLDDGYQVARPVLRERQHGKCAFCEKREDAFKRPVEHFRPKKGAEDRVGGRWVEVKTHYWWLAWTWNNLYFACDECNRSGHKGSRFPIEAGSSRVAAPSRGVADPIPPAHYDLSAERRLLVDPREDNPLTHIQWMPKDRTRPKPDWSWIVEGADDRGDMTIEVLGLKAREDEVNGHLAPLKLLWKQIDGHLGAGRLADAQACWSDTVREYVEDPKRPFRCAAWWALNSLCPRSDRLNHRFREPPVPAVVFVARPAS